MFYFDNPTMGISFIGKNMKVWVHVIRMNLNFSIILGPKVDLYVIFEMLR